MAEENVENVGQATEQQEEKEEVKETARKIFLGGLNYETTEDGLQDHFGQFGEIVDVVVIRFPDTKRSRGFGFVTFQDQSQADKCFNEPSHTIDGHTVELKWATPKEEMDRQAGENGEEGANGGMEPESLRKVFVGGLNYSTTSEGLKEHFSAYGELVDSVVLRFHDTNRSRGFGFVTYAKSEMVDACQAARPHVIDGTTVETKRATPKEDSNSGATGKVTKIFIGGIKDNQTDDHFQEYFGQFGNVTNVEQMMDKQTGRKRGFGFVEFDDYDAVDKVILKGRHEVNGHRVDVKKAVSKSDMNMMGRDGGGGRHRDDRRDYRGSRRDYGGRGGAPSPWSSDVRGGGGGGGFGNSYANPFGNSGGGFGGGDGGWGGGRSMNPWQDNYGGGGGGGDGGYSGGGGGAAGGLNSSWESQGGHSGWGGSGGGAGVPGSGYGGSYGSGGFNGSGYGSGYGSGGGGGGPMRNQMGGGMRNAPYSMGDNRGGGGYNSYKRGGASGRW